MNTQIKTKKLDTNSIGTAYKMTREEKDISFLNNYFIFKKVRDVNLQDLSVSLSYKSPKIIEQEALETILAQKEVVEALEDDSKKVSEKKLTKKKILVLKPSKK